MNKHFLAEEVPLRDQFKDIDDITLEYTEDEDWDNKVITFKGIDNIPTELRCSYSKCRDGGCSIATDIKLMLKSRETTKTGTWNCRGRIGKQKSEPCTNTFRYKIHVKYNDK